MDFNIPPMFAYALSWFGFMGGTWALFDRAETVISEGTRKDISRWLLRSELKPSEGWQNSFAVVFDKIFGERHFSFHCFFFSCVASTITLLILSLAWIAMVASDHNLPTNEKLWETLLFFLVFGAMFNLVTDYFSLLETRFILRKMSNIESSKALIVYLGTDIILTTLIVFIGIGIPILFLENLSFVRMWDELSSGYAFSPREVDQFQSTAVFIYSTYLTSVWIWLFLVSGAWLRVVGVSDRILQFLKGFLDFEAKPLRSIGFLSNIFITIVYLGLLLAR